jgi:radical SAM protein with 4Fe4S-binding SPASM domain
MSQLFKRAKSLYKLIPYHFLNGRTGPIRRLNLTVTYRCNLNCKMCLQRQEASNTTKRPELSGDEIRTLIRGTIPRLTQIGFCGGEIFLRNDIMDLLQFAAARNPIGFATNGTFMTPDMARAFVKMGVDFILFSLDGTESIHDRIRGKAGTFKKAVSALENLIRTRTDAGSRKPQVHVNCVVMEDNVDHLSELVDIVAAVKGHHLGLQIEDHCAARFSSVSDASVLREPISRRNHDFAKDLEKIIVNVQELARRKNVALYLKPDSTPAEFASHYRGEMVMAGYYCTAPWAQVIVSPHGEVYPCYMLDCGNTRKKPMAEIWNGEELVRFRREVRAAGLLPQCYGCCFMERKSRRERGPSLHCRKFENQSAP